MLETHYQLLSNWLFQIYLFLSFIPYLYIDLVLVSIWFLTFYFDYSILYFAFRLNCFFNTFLGYFGLWFCLILMLIWLSVLWLNAYPVKLLFWYSAKWIYKEELSGLHEHDQLVTNETFYIKSMNLLTDQNTTVIMDSLKQLAFALNGCQLLSCFKCMIKQFHLFYRFSSDNFTTE